MPHEDVSLSARISILLGLPPPENARAQAANASGESIVASATTARPFSVVIA